MEMNNKHKFYPMITQTVKTILSLADNEDKLELLYILQYYPNLGAPEEEIQQSPRTALELIKELDRQYAQWNKGGVK
jgi:hypothetical protein